MHMYREQIACNTSGPRIEPCTCGTPKRTARQCPVGLVVLDVQTIYNHTMNQSINT